MYFLKKFSQFVCGEKGKYKPVEIYFLKGLGENY